MPLGEGRIRSELGPWPPGRCREGPTGVCPWGQRSGRARGEATEEDQESRQSFWAGGGEGGATETSSASVRHRSPPVTAVTVTAIATTAEPAVTSQCHVPCSGLLTIGRAYYHPHFARDEAQNPKV